ncbi:hypothetical protein [Flammeovirga sp. SJP92]|uniref:hypothetical protein n=1 Tax=Flammeovirga sp. SJP92 TaxID=1775430 RepID=UPI000787C2EC|nr:hypothetical protein [Flammeovirga sp. SJP92]KXX69661.1 hypothetical protein AVL50_15480 [Flammeovirga sp. SJP92]
MQAITKLFYIVFIQLVFLLIFPSCQNENKKDKDDITMVKTSITETKKNIKLELQNNTLDSQKINLYKKQIIGKWVNKEAEKGVTKFYQDYYISLNHPDKKVKYSITKDNQLVFHFSDDLNVEYDIISFTEDSIHGVNAFDYNLILYKIKK